MFKYIIFLFICFKFSTTADKSHPNDDSRIHVSFHTAFEFNKRDRNNDLKLLQRVQQVIDKVKHVIVAPDTADEKNKKNEIHLRDNLDTIFRSNTKDKLPTRNDKALKVPNARASRKSRLNNKSVRIKINNLTLKNPRKEQDMKKLNDESDEEEFHTYSRDTETLASNEQYNKSVTKETKNEDILFENDLQTISLVLPSRTSLLLPAETTKQEENHDSKPDNLKVIKKPNNTRKLYPVSSEDNVQIVEKPTKTTIPPKVIELYKNILRRVGNLEEEFNIAKSQTKIDESFIGDFKRKIFKEERALEELRGKQKNDKA